MKRHHAKLVALGILTTGCVGTAFGQAQDARGKGNGQPAPAAAGEGRQKPPRTINNDSARPRKRNNVASTATNVPPAVIEPPRKPWEFANLFNSFTDAHE